VEGKKVEKWRTPPPKWGGTEKNYKASVPTGGARKRCFVCENDGFKKKGKGGKAFSRAKKGGVEKKQKFRKRRK